MPSKQIVVIGSLNVDFITRISRIPDPGETLEAHSFDTGFGGKGANQAVACARLASQDVKVGMVGKVGDDIFGREYYTCLKSEGIDVSGVRTVHAGKTGVANILVDESSGENRILFTANANNSYTEDADNTWSMVPTEAGVVVFQLEIPLRVVLHNLQIAHESGAHVIFNPAPARALPDWAYQHIDTLIMNETESQILASSRGLEAKLSPEELAPRFLGFGVRDVIITLGKDGLVYATSSGASGRLPARKVKVVDTTAAGDTFVGAFAVQRALHGKAAGFDYVAALSFATLAASRSVERNGAMSAIPYLKELEHS